jgi:hypothetical protein
MTTATTLTAELRAAFRTNTSCKHAHPLARAVACARRDYVASWRIGPAAEAAALARYNAAVAAVDAAA